MTSVAVVHQDDVLVEYVPQIIGRFGPWCLVIGPFDKD